MLRHYIKEESLRVHALCAGYVSCVGWVVYRRLGQGAWTISLILSNLSSPRCALWLTGFGLCALVCSTLSSPADVFFIVIVINSFPTLQSTYKLYSSRGYGVTVNSKGGSGFRFGSSADISLCPERRRLVARKAGTVFIQHRVGIAHTHWL